MLSTKVNIFTFGVPWRSICVVLLACCYPFRSKSSIAVRKSAKTRLIFHHVIACATMRCTTKRHLAIKRVNRTFDTKLSWLVQPCGRIVGICFHCCCLATIWHEYIRISNPRIYIYMIYIYINIYIYIYIYI